MTIKGSAILIVFVVSLASCSNKQKGEVFVKEDLTAKQLLQGIWVNDETEMPLPSVGLHIYSPSSVEGSFSDNG